MIHDGTISACHDVADGGLLVTAAEMALAGDVGLEITVPAGTENPKHWLFGEDQGRYLLETDSPEMVLKKAEDAGVSAVVLGLTGGTALTVSEEPPISLNRLRDTHEGWLPQYMANE